MNEPPVLRNPMLIMAFEGWNDAGDAATTAASHLAERFRAEPFATIDPEPFFDFSTNRPMVRLDGDGQRRIDWPANEFLAAHLPDATRDVIILTGSEPQLKWRTFSQQIVELAKQLDVGLVVTLGALIADVAHSRPITVYGTSHDRGLCEELQLEPSTYEGPTGIVGVVHAEFQQAAMASMSLWAAVPSYVPHAPSPKAALALVERVGDILKTPTVTSSLVSQAEDYVTQIDSLVADDDETGAYVRQIEEQYDASMRPESTAELIEELEEFLKDQ
jgi:predicted ATP-grasp superfamily ATP-dependent carboligase